MGRGDKKTKKGKHLKVLSEKQDHLRPLRKPPLKKKDNPVILLTAPIFLLSIYHY
jgi:hypothetical protein